MRAQCTSSLSYCLCCAEQAFNRFDKDGSGYIEGDELHAILLAVGQEISDDELAEMMAVVDADGSGKIDFWEFCTLISHKMADPNPERTLRAAFSVFDDDNDGTISAKELKRVMR